MSHLLDRRAPKSNRGFSWGRFPSETTVQYRLFRRDRHGVRHMFPITFAKNVTTEQMALDLNKKRRELRDLVDEIDLADLEDK